MKVVVKMWGNSAAVRIPAAVMQAADLKQDQEVDVREDEGRVIIEPVRRVTFDLATLLEGITRDNLHGEIPAADAVGQEVWSRPSTCITP